MSIKRGNKVGAQQQPFFHEKTSSTSSPDKGKKKKQRAPCLGDFLFVGMQIVQGKERKYKIEEGKKLETFLRRMQQCILRVSRVEATMSEHVL